MPEIPLFKVFMSEDVIDPMTDVLLSGYIGQGPQVESFERSLANFVGNSNVCTVNSGTSALHLALRLVNTGDRNEVLTTPLTCAATNLPIIANGLKIRWVDVDPNTCSMDLSDLRRKIGSNTLAIMVVHWGGCPVDLDELRDIQEECLKRYGHKPIVIEDCAHAFGATYNGKHLGNHGNVCAFSFQAIKHLTTGDGGMLVLPDAAMLERAKLLRWYGLDRTSNPYFRQDIPEWGYKFHMNDIAATIGLNNLPHIQRNIAKHRENSNYYRLELRDISGIRLMDSKPDRDSSEWVFTIRVDNRDSFVTKMGEKGIGCARIHGRNDTHTCFSESAALLPNTDLVCSDMCCIPCGWWVSEDDRDYIVDCVKRVLEDM